MPNKNLKENIIHINHNGTGNVIIEKAIIDISKTSKSKKKKPKKVTNAKEEKE